MLILYLSRCKREKTPLSIRICNADALSISIYNAFTPKVHNSSFLSASHMLILTPSRCKREETQTAE
ncbi:MAG: hypothetical protein E7092_05665 [Bacteroidales bacterium]|nr:hypothetical protein [Bacteroidales bacterium]